MTYKTIVQDQIEQGGGFGFPCQVFVKLNTREVLVSEVVGKDVSTTEEEQAKRKICAERIDGNTLRMTNPDRFNRQPTKEFKYDRVYSALSTNKEMYRDLSAFVLVRSYDSLIRIYLSLSLLSFSFFYYFTSLFFVFHFLLFSFLYLLSATLLSFLSCVSFSLFVTILFLFFSFLFSSTRRMPSTATT